MNFKYVKFNLWQMMAIVAIVAILIGATKMLLDSRSPRLWERWLEGSDPSLRQTGAQELGRLGSHSLAAIPALIRALRSDSNPKVRKQAAISLYTIISEHGDEQQKRDTTFALIESQRDQDPDVQGASAVGMSVLRVDAELTIPALLRAIKESDPWCRGVAVQELARRIPRELASQDEVIGAVLAVMTDENTHVRPLATEAFIILTEKAPSVASIALNSTDVRFRRAATNALCRNGLRAGAALLDLLSALNDEDAEVRETAGKALLVAIPDARSNVPLALIAGLKDRNVAVRRAAVKVIGEYGARAKGALQALESAKQDEDEEVRRFAEKAIGSIWIAQEDIRITVVHLTDLLKVNDPSKRSFAAESLHRMGGDAVPALGELTRVIQEDTDEGVRESAARAKDAITSAVQ